MNEFPHHIGRGVACSGISSTTSKAILRIHESTERMGCALTPYAITLIKTTLIWVTHALLHTCLGSYCGRHLASVDSCLEGAELDSERLCHCFSCRPEPLVQLPRWEACMQLQCNQNRCVNSSDCICQHFAALQTPRPAWREYRTVW